jgi:hypothetical protein
MRRGTLVSACVVVMSFAGCEKPKEPPAKASVSQELEPFEMSAGGSGMQTLVPAPGSSGDLYAISAAGSVWRIHGTEASRVKEAPAPFVPPHYGR